MSLGYFTLTVETVNFVSDNQPRRVTGVPAGLKHPQIGDVISG